jgi:CRISPR-associated protein Cas1
MALHALAYCERLFYLEEVEEIRVADERVYAGRRLHEDLGSDASDAVETRNFDLASDSLGLIGRSDAFRRRDGAWVPYEHKRGRPMDTPDGHAAWPSDALQATAYAMLLEDHLHVPIHEARVRYHAANVTVRIPVDDAARERVRAAILRARELRASTQRPPITTNDRLCLHCSLAPVCLPEEERLAVEPAWDTVRLFPPERSGQVLHVVEPGARVSRSADTLSVVRTNGGRETFPIKEIAALVLHGYPQCTTQAIHACARNGISVHFLSGGGRYVAGLAPGAGPVQRHLRQFQALSDAHLCLNLAKRLATARSEGQLRYLLRGTRGKGERPPEVADALEAIRRSIKAMPDARDIDSLRGHEGAAGRAYFAALPALLRPEVPEPLIPRGRSRRPPRDRFNALLSMGYALLYQSVMSSVLAVGLEPAVGFYHTPRSAAHPLVLDLMELFRVPVWDVAVVGSVNRLHWDPAEDFAVTGVKVWLSDTGRRKAIKLYEDRLAETWKHPVTQYSLSYERTIELEVRLLEKEWTGSPGLFARARLR